jgi:mannose-1-phosphate guanylyltransferase
MKLIIFAGGVGTRLWPLSRQNAPKQFGKLIGEHSTLQQSVERLLSEFPAQDIYIATGVQYKDIVREQLSYIPKENFIFEPAMRDVAPAIGLSVFLLDKKFSEEPMAILWSDHIVKKEKAFLQALRAAEEQISSLQSEFVFLAQKPRFANQNCGWIELGDEIQNQDSAKIYKFKKLWYRPQLEEAEGFYQSKRHVWNLGYFVSTPKYLKSLYKKFMPEMFDKLSQIQLSHETPEYQKTLQALYPGLEKLSFDDAILTRLDPDNFRVISADLGWSDVGTWDALKEALAENKDENITVGDVLIENTKDTLLYNYTKKLCLGIDLKELIIINTDDVLLVCPKNSVPKIKKIVEKLKGSAFDHLV